MRNVIALCCGHRTGLHAGSSVCSVRLTTGDRACSFEDVFRRCWRYAVPEAKQDTSKRHCAQLTSAHKTLRGFAMLSGLFQHAWSPSLAPCSYLFRTQQLTNLRHFRPFSRSPRVVARAAAPAVTQRKDKAPTQPVPAEFRQLGLSSDLVVATQEIGLAEPTEIQVSTAAASCLG